ncbi:ATP-binding protein [Methylobacterium sp. WL18]|uniref:ATP-binding protein n=1 Tax=Methylobacterium sp. WL18 TaxID=2603897 RepID=UPI0011C7F3D1|nr:ATP-binding protein [Methylobacterium sp. WL18]TXN76151.1 ATP-binding protein [Methylobacterium sp. WL18]
MDVGSNPYAPGAGTRPPLLAGRDDLVENATVALARAKKGRHAKSFVAVGLRGVGKTVVLNKVLELAEAEHYQVAYLEAHDNASLAALLIPQLRTIMLRINRMEGAKEIGRKGLSILRNFANGLKINIADVEVGLDFGAEAGVADSGDLANDLPELFTAIGQAAADRKTAVAILVDEIQYLQESEIGALIMAVHRVNQRGLPVVLIAAGLPQILGKMGESKSYAERLFDFPRVEALRKNDAISAVSVPASDEGVEFTDEALEVIYEVTKGYPYFLQEWAYVTWNIAQSSPIGAAVVRAAELEAIRRLDESFFRVRLERMTPTERRYIQAMGRLGIGPHSSGDIAKRYGASVSTVAPLRANLISKGMIWSPAYGMTDFTVPLFDEFVRREMP